MEDRHELPDVSQPPVAGCVVVDAEGRIVLADSAAANILKAPADALTGAAIEHWLPPAGTHWRDDSHGHCHAERDNGVQLSVDIERHTTGQAGAEIQLWRLTDADASDRRALALAAQLSADTALRALAHSLGHDLREPLRAVACYSELLSTRLPQPLDERTQRYLGYLLDGARRLQRRVSAGVAYTRAAQQLDSAEEVDLIALVRSELGHEVRVQGADAAQRRVLLGDETKLRRALSHVLGYLRSPPSKEAAEPPSVDVAITVNDHELTLRLSNAHMELSQDAAARVFRLFDRTREDQSGEATESSSPAIAQRIVEQHGGTLWLDAGPDQGVTFFMRLPAKAAHADASGEAH